MKIFVNEGVQYDENTFSFDFDHDSDADVINLVGPKIYKSNFSDNIYYFGYKFADTASSRTRSEFIRALKSSQRLQISASDFNYFLNRPLGMLNKSINLSNIQAVVYPISGLNNLVKRMINAVISFMQHGTEYIEAELVKNMPGNVEFDWKAFASAVGGTSSQSYKDSTPIIENILERIHKSDYFSIARDVKPKYRPYMMNYLRFEHDLTGDKLRGLTFADNILVIDDINTSGSTLHEILRILHSWNTQSNIYIFTLIGKE